MREIEPVVIIIEEQGAAPVRARSRVVEPRRLPRWPSRTIGVTLTVIVHLLISTPFVLGTAAHKRRPSPDGSGSTTWASPGEQSESMILLDLSALSAHDDSDMPRSTPSESALVEELTLQLVGGNPKPPPDVTLEEDAAESDEANRAAGDPSGTAVMFGK